ncbi:g5569 [Coccomyxa elongata]
MFHARASLAADMPQVPRTELAEGLQISQVIKGCWQLSGGHGGERESDRTSGKAAVEDFKPFVQAGITTFDTADIYGPSESVIGEYLRESGEKKNVQVLTKFCCFGRDMQSADSANFVKRGVENSLRSLGVDALDLVQFYWHDYGVGKYVGAAQRLAELQEAALIRHVGVTNFDVPRLAEIVDAGVRIVSNQVQYSLLDRRPENFMVPYCSEQGIKLLPYGTVAGGFLSERYLGLPASKVRVDTYSKSKYASVISQSGGWDWFQALLRELDGVARKHDVDIATVASRWVLDQPQVAGVIVGARNSRHVAQHRKLFTFALDDEDRGRIDAVLERARRPQSDCYTWERGGSWA